MQYFSVRLFCRGVGGGWYLGLYGNIVSKIEIVHIYNWTCRTVCILFCCSTREIKPDGPGIGVRVKVRNPVLPPRRDRNPVSSLGPSGMHLKHNYPPKPLNNGYVSSSHHGIVNGNSMPNLAHTKPQGNNYAQKPGNPEIMRRPLRYINWNFVCEYYALWYPDFLLSLWLKEETMP